MREGGRGQRRFNKSLARFVNALPDGFIFHLRVARRDVREKAIYLECTYRWNCAQSTQPFFTAAKFSEVCAFNLLFFLVHLTCLDQEIGTSDIARTSRSVCVGPDATQTTSSHVQMDRDTKTLVKRP